MKWIQVAQFSNSLEANLARGRLEAADLRVETLDENLVANDWMLSNAVGGIKLMVPPEQAETARGLLAEIDAGAKLKGDAPTCPHCESAEVDERRQTWAYTVFAVAAVLLTAGLAIFLRRPRFTCRACRQQWG